MKHSHEPELVPEEYGAIGQLTSIEEAKNNRQSSLEPRPAHHSQSSLSQPVPEEVKRNQQAGQRAKSVMANPSSTGRRGITLLGEANSQVSQLVAAVGQQHRQVNIAAAEREVSEMDQRYIYDLPFLNKYVGYRS